MHGACLDHPLHKWFDFKTPKTSIAPDYIVKALHDEDFTSHKPNSKIVWLGNMPVAEKITKSKKGSTWEMMSLTFQTKKEAFNIKVNEPQGNWLLSLFKRLPATDTLLTLQDIKNDYEAAGLDDFELFWDNKPVNTLYKAGLLQL